MLCAVPAQSWAFVCLQASWLWDTILFKKAKAQFGGRIRFVVSGGAPLAPHVEQFMKAVLCVPVVQVSLPGVALGWKPVLSSGSCSSPWWFLQSYQLPTTHESRKTQSTSYRMPLFAEGEASRYDRPPRLVKRSCLKQGYGLTETTGTSFVQLPTQKTTVTGAVGPPTPATEFKFEVQLLLERLPTL